MRLDVVKTVFLKELRETLRDRRSVAVMFGIPLLLYPVLAIGLANLGLSRQKEMSETVYRVVMVNPMAAPRLLDQLEKSKLFSREMRDNPAAALARGEVDAVLVVPPDCETMALASKKVEIRVQIDRSRSEAPIIEKKLDRLLDEYQSWLIEQRLKDRGVPSSVLQPIARETDDIATGSQRLGRILAFMLPNVLLLTGMMGALFPALNSTTTERETGTLETLLVTPAGRTELLVAKTAMVLLSALVTAALNLVSMSLVLWRLLSQIGSLQGTLSLSPTGMLLTYIAAVPALIFFAALVMIVGLFARNFREANAYATPVMLLPLISIAVSIAEPGTSAGLLITPIVNTTLIIRDVLTARATAGAFLLALCSSFVYAGLMLHWAGRMFTSEQLVNPAWEPLSLRGLRNIRRPRESRLPSLDEAIVLFALTLLLLFYISPSLVKLGAMGILAVNEIMLIGVPTLLFAWLGRYQIRETFSVRSSDWRGMAGAAMIGIGIAPLINLLGYLQSKVWPADPQSARAQLDLFAGLLLKHPVHTMLAIGGLAGIFEELLYRGPIQSALVRKLRLWPALVVGGILFAAAHMDLHGTPIRALIGVLLGWVAWRSRSIFPAMLLHGIYDATQLGFVGWELHRRGSVDALMSAAARAPFWTLSNCVILAMGLALTALGWWLFKSSTPTADVYAPPPRLPAPRGFEVVHPSATSRSQ